MAVAVLVQTRQYWRIPASMETPEKQRPGSPRSNVRSPARCSRARRQNESKCACKHEARGRTYRAELAHTLIGTVDRHFDLTKLFPYLLPNCSVELWQEQVLVLEDELSGVDLSEWVLHGDVQLPCHKGIVTWLVYHLFVVE